MKLSSVIIALAVCCLIASASAFWGFTFKRKNAQCPSKNSKTGNEYTDNDCDENQLMLQLARLYIISPERIILLLTMDTLQETCHDIACILSRINVNFTSCKPLPNNNLYMKLYDGLEYFNAHICNQNDTSYLQRITQFQDCLKELKEELIECEGTPDWFEKGNSTIVCQYFDEIIDCNYVKTATLCGLGPAITIRNFSAEVLNSVLLVKCPVIKTLPHVDDPMISRSFALKVGFLGCCYIIFSMMF